jgi:non-ribosomal peptide synthase protein (TIGR01720 family)
LGQMDQASAGAGVIAPARESAGPVRSASGSRSHAIDINGGISAGRLELEWSYSANLHERSTVERLADAFLDALREIILRSESMDSIDVKLTEFSEFGWSEEDLSEIETEIFDLED